MQLSKYSYVNCKRYFLLLILIAFPCFAWNSTGHRVMAQIAYDQLTPEARYQVDRLTQQLFHSHNPDTRFLRAATWADRLHSKNQSHHAWHYINLPIIENHTKPPLVARHNVVWAIRYTEWMLMNRANTPSRRAKYLAFLIHFVGDVHQPLHCATLYNDRFPSPRGDAGGNFYRVRSPIAENLHQLWDQGLGLFYSGSSYYDRFRRHVVFQIAQQWMQAYPKSFFGTRLKIQSSSRWAKESYRIAKNDVYSIRYGEKPSQQYLQRGHRIVREQIVLAGDRLAQLLNAIFRAQDHH